MPKRAPQTEAEREQRRAADRAFVAQAVEQLRSSGGWQRWLATRRHFHTYSLRNQLLLAMQKLASHCLLERDDYTPGPTAASARGPRGAAVDDDLRDIRSPVTWTECHGTATPPDHLTSQPGGLRRGRHRRRVGRRPARKGISMATNKQRLTEAERDQRRARDRQRLKDACEQLLCSEGWQRWVRARARNGLARYSVSNLCLILLANPNASFVASFKAWLELGYCVRKGEHAIRIFAPMPTRRRSDSGAETDEEQRRVLFRAVPVFDRGQVEPRDGRQPAPLEPPSQPLTGDSHAHLLEPTTAFAGSLGYAVAFQATPPGTGGWCDRAKQRIVVDADAPPNAQLRIVVHETAHALGIDYQSYTREQAEVMVDTVTYIVCAGLGLAIDGESVPYVAGWGEDGALDAVNQFAATIDRHARQIESAITGAAANRGALST